MAWNTSGWGNWMAAQCYAICHGNQENLIDCQACPPMTITILRGTPRSLFALGSNSEETPAGTKGGALLKTKV